MFRWQGKELTLLDDSLRGPNGIAFSPDEKFLYVGNWDPDAKTVTRFPVKRDGSLGAGEVFIDLTQQVPGDEALDGIKVDQQRQRLFIGARRPVDFRGRRPSPRHRHAAAAGA